MMEDSGVVASIKCNVASINCGMMMMKAESSFVVLMKDVITIISIV